MASPRAWPPAEDGSFRLTVPPGKGYLTVVGPTLDYIPRELGGGIVFGSGKPGGHRIHAHDFVAYDVQAGETPHVINATLKPGKTLRGRIVGPAGETVQDAVDPLPATDQPEKSRRGKNTTSSTPATAASS